MNIVTWNMQGSTGTRESKWNTDVKRIFLQTNVEVALLQEAGVPPSAVAVVPLGFLFGALPPPAFNLQSLLWNSGTASRPRNIGIFWLHCDLGANRNNLAIAFDVAAVNPQNFLYLNNPVGAANRPAIGIRFAYGGGSLDVYTLHAFSGGGGDAPGFLAAINARGANWAVGGDFNRAPPPPLWAGAPGVLCPHNAVPTHPGSGTNLDYAFKRFAPAVTGIVDANFIVSDHFPVYYVI